MQRCLMLDVDGVVVNGRPEDGKSWATDIERDLGIAPARLQELFFAPHWRDIVIGRKNLMEVLDACLPALSESRSAPGPSTPGPSTPALTAQAFVDYWFARDCAVDAAVVAACDDLRRRGLRIFLATNQEHLRARYLMERLALREHVDGMVYSAEVGARKPQAAFFEAAAKHSGAAPETLLLVDDTQANVDAARDAGWAALRWTRGADLTQLVTA